MLIVGFDPSKTTGWAIFDTKRNFAAIQCGVFEMPDKADHYYTGDQIGLKVAKFLRDCKGKYGQLPDFVVLEEQILVKVPNTSADAMIYPWVATTAIVSTIANFGIPYGTLTSGSWRKLFYGAGFKPPLDNKGKKDWKTAAIKECERIGVVLPSQKTKAHNAAEAVALAICWHHKEMRLHAGRYQDPWMKLVQARGQKAVA